jgi:penicillin-binding protein 1C
VDAALPVPASASGAVRVCAASGQLAGPDCPHQLELERPSSGAPHERCSWHERRCRDAHARASDGCPVVEVIPDHYLAWAHDSGRLGPSTELAARAHGPPAGPPRIVFPSARQRFLIDANVSPEQQGMVLRAEAPADARLRFAVDGVLLCEARAPFQCPWPATRGRHTLQVEADTGASARIAFEVE